MSFLLMSSNLKKTTHGRLRVGIPHLSHDQRLSDTEEPHGRRAGELPGF